MPINPVPDRSAVVEEDARSAAMVLTPPWREWCKAVFSALMAWRRTMTSIKTHDFGLIAAQAQATTTVAVAGARAGDAVLVRPTNRLNGIFIDGTVSADDTVEIRACNFSAAGIDPASQDYRVIVWQQ